LVVFFQGFQPFIVLNTDSLHTNTSFSVGEPHIIFKTVLCLFYICNIFTFQNTHSDEKKRPVIYKAS